MYISMYKCSLDTIGAVFESGDCADELCNARKVDDLLLSKDARLK